METVDELVTPGCPNCVIKHLSAALAAMACDRKTDMCMWEAPSHAVLALRAYINLCESQQGYPSHFDFAVGLLAIAESSALATDAPVYAKCYRDVRLELIQRGVRAVDSTLIFSTFFSVGTTEFYNRSVIAAHLQEAYREAPQDIDLKAMIESPTRMVSTHSIQQAIARVRKEFFDFDQGEKPAEEKGEEHMATAKKAPAKAAAKKAAPVKAAAKKAPAKAAVKAAAKGGKTKKCK